MSDRAWKLGDDLIISDNLLDGLTFASAFQWLQQTLDHQNRYREQAGRLDVNGKRNITGPVWMLKKERKKKSNEYHQRREKS